MSLWEMLRKLGLNMKKIINTYTYHFNLVSMQENEVVESVDSVFKIHTLDDGEKIVEESVVRNVQTK